MKLPNGYGSVIKLKGKRRKPWAVRTSYLEEQPDGTVKRKRKYLAYFAEQKHALSYLAEYNNGSVIPEHQKYSNVPTFAELFDKWKSYRNSLKSKPTAATWKNYNIAFNFYAPIHHKKIISIKAQDIQDCITAQNNKSRTTIGAMRTVVKGMWDYAIINEYVQTDITQRLVYEYAESGTPIHTRFTDSEISKLWDALWTINNVDIILIYIYTGCRPVELLEIKSEDVHIEERYMIGGVKTEAGRNRIIPIHEAIVPLIEYRLAQKRPYLITNKYGNHYTRAVYHNSNWNTVMKKMQFNHAPHDCRYTFASLADNANMNEICKKLIMGHALANKNNTAFKTGDAGDITSGVYTEKTIADLIAEVNKLPVKFV